MVNKSELLNDLKRYLSFEEEIVQKLSAFYQALGWKTAVKEECYHSIKKGLNVLKEESKKHARMVKSMVKYVEESNKDAF